MYAHIMQTSKPERAPLERVNVNLTARSVTALGRVAALTGDTKTDTINKALQFYDYILEFLHSGGSLYMRDDGGDLERVRVF